MNSIDDILKETRQLANLIQDSSSATKNEIVPVTTSDSFRQSMLTFLENRMADVKKNMSMIDIIDAELVKKILLKELSGRELMQLRSSIQQSANSTTSSILEPFKPNNNTGSTLLNPPKDDSVTSKPVTEQLTPEQRTAIHKLEQLINMGNSRVQARKVEEEGEELE